MSDFKSVFELDAAQLLHLDGGMLVAIRYENERIRIPAVIIVRVKELLEAEKKARNLHVALPPGAPGLGGGPQAPAPAPAPTWPIVLGRGPLSPGMRLVELLPIDTSAAVTRTFAAVEAPNPPREGEPAPGAFATEASVHPVQPAPASRTRGTGVRARRFAVTALTGGVAASMLLVGCLVRVASNPAGAREMEPLQVYTDKTKAKEAEKGASDDSIPMPKKPYAWQKIGPCNSRRGEVEKVGGCWGKMASPPPCSSVAVESEGECFVPITAPPKAPMSSNP